MGFLDWINRKIIQPVFRPIFGNQTGSATPLMSKIAHTATGGRTDISGVLDNMIAKGGLVNSLDMALAKLPSVVDEMTSKASDSVKKIPLIGTALSAEIEKVGGMTKGSLESAKDYKALPAMLDEELSLSKGSKAILGAVQRKAGAVPFVGETLSKEVGKVINTVDEYRDKAIGLEKQVQDAKAHEDLKDQGALHPTTQ
jgi:hypothetical protein